MKIDVPDGEIADKYSILCLKMEHIQDEKRKKEVSHEKDLLRDYAVSLIDKFPMYYELLCHINRLIWDKTNIFKSLDMCRDLEGFAALANEIFSLNEQRFRLKRIFDTHSDLKEQKSYAEKKLRVSIRDHASLFRKLNGLICAVLVYDKIDVLTKDDKVIQTISKWMPLSCVSYFEDLDLEVLEDRFIDAVDFVPDSLPSVASIVERFTKAQT